MQVVKNINDPLVNTYTMYFAGIVVLTALLMLIGVYFMQKHNDALGKTIIITALVIIFVATVLYAAVQIKERRHKINIVQYTVSQSTIPVYKEGQ